MTSQGHKRALQRQIHMFLISINAPCNLAS